MRILRTYEHQGLILQVAEYEAEPPARARLSLLRAPGARRFEIDRIDAVLEGEEIILSGRISGKNVAYVYAELLLKDPDADRYYGPVVREHVLAGRTKETRGVSRPDWDDSMDLSIRLAPTLRVLSDGTGFAFCFPVPEGYGRPGYRLDGLYVPAGGAAARDAAAVSGSAASAGDAVPQRGTEASAGDAAPQRGTEASAGDAAPQRARLILDENGEAKEIVAQKEQGRRSLPHRLTPKPGDRFTPFVKALIPPAGDEDWGVETVLADTLTFRDTPLRMVTYAPIPGDYLAGLLVEDFDGRLTRSYAPLTIGGEEA